MSTPSAPGGQEPPGEVVPRKMGVRTLVVMRWGLLAWAVALVVLLAVPDLRAGNRSWWVWVPVAALVLGGAGYLYLRRGRGNAAGA